MKEDASYEAAKKLPMGETDEFMGTFSIPEPLAAIKAGLGKTSGLLREPSLKEEGVKELSEQKDEPMAVVGTQQTIKQKMANASVFKSKRLSQKEYRPIFMKEIPLKLNSERQ